jgi:SAM-dependent methyltransferase
MYGAADDLRFRTPGPSDRVLDAGCGSGSMTRAIARAQSNGEAFGLDRELRYIDFARRKAKSEQIENAQFGVGDVLSLPFPDGVFDLLMGRAAAASARGVLEQLLSGGTYRTPAFQLGGSRSPGATTGSLSEGLSGASHDCNEWAAKAGGRSRRVAEELWPAAGRPRPPE